MHNKPWFRSKGHTETAHRTKVFVDNLVKLAREVIDCAVKVARADKHYQPSLKGITGLFTMVTVFKFSLKRLFSFKT